MFKKTTITNIQRSFLRVLSIVLLIALLSLNVAAQSGERIVILWDVTGSLLPQKEGMKDLDGSKIPVYAQGNGMWKDLKEAIIECIQYAVEDPGNEITIVTFNDAVRDVYTQKASAEGKQSLVDYVRTYKYKSHKYTNIVDPVNRFYSLLGKDKINYMFLFTDGDNDHPTTKAQLIPTLDSWTTKTSGQNAYGFYVLVHPDADKSDIRNSVQSQDNFWIVKDAKVRIKICSFPSSLKYNIRDEKGPKTISIRGKYANADGKVQLVSNDQYYDIICSDLAIANGKLDIVVKPKEGVVPPASHTLILTPQLSDADPYTFVGPKEISLSVSNLPERSLVLTFEDKNLGKASYNGAFLISKAASKPVLSDIKVEFSDQAKAENSSAVMKVYLVDKKTEQKISPDSQNLTISIDGKVLTDGSFKLTPEMANAVLSISGQPETKSGSYYGRIELEPSNLDNYSINGSPDVFKWKMNFSQKWNPLKLGLAWLIGILCAAFLLWMFILKPIFYPRFGSIQKTFNVPGMAPLIVKFKGARMVVVADSHQNKQSGWNRFWTGKVLYKTHPVFTSPIAMRPVKRKVLVKADNSIYHVSPNPMPGVGTATIDNVRSKMHITIN